MDGGTTTRVTAFLTERLLVRPAALFGHDMPQLDTLRGYSATAGRTGAGPPGSDHLVV